MIEFEIWPLPLMASKMGVAEVTMIPIKNTAVNAACFILHKDERISRAITRNDVAKNTVCNAPPDIQVTATLPMGVIAYSLIGTIPKPIDSDKAKLGTQ